MIHLIGYNIVEAIILYASHIRYLSTDLYLKMYVNIFRPSELGILKGEKMEIGWYKKCLFNFWNISQNYAISLDRMDDRESMTNLMKYRCATESMSEV